MAILIGSFSLAMMAPEMQGTSLSFAEVFGDWASSAYTYPS
jgi:hypothetical protein